MKRLIALSVVLAIVLSGALALAQTRTAPPPNGEHRIGILYLFQKDPVENGPWTIKQGGAWGEMRYNLWGDEFSFIFQGRNLKPRTDYTLIYYPDPWPGNGLLCLASGKANPAGNLALVKLDFPITYSLPAPFDANHTPMPPSGAVGAKIWLVLSADVKCPTKADPASSMKAWNPDKYLFEYNLINFEYRPD